MSTCVFHCVKGRLSEEDCLALLVWLFEVPPSDIHIEGCKVTVPSTYLSRFIYNAYCTYAYKFSRKDVIGTNYGIILRQFSMPYITNYTGFWLLNNVSFGHPISGQCIPVTRRWEFKSGLSYRNTGATLPISY